MLVVSVHLAGDCVRPGTFDIWKRKLKNYRLEKKYSADTNIIVLDETLGADQLRKFSNCSELKHLFNNKSLKGIVTEKWLQDSCTLVNCDWLDYAHSVYTNSILTPEEMKQFEPIAAPTPTHCSSHAPPALVVEGLQEGGEVDNSGIVKILSNMGKVVKRLKRNNQDEYRAKKYAGVADIIKKQLCGVQLTIDNYKEELKRVLKRSVGFSNDSSLEKLFEEYFKCGTQSILDKLLEDPVNITILELHKLHGIGSATAYKLIKDYPLLIQGGGTIKALRDLIITKHDVIPSVSVIALPFVEQYKSKMSRLEAEGLRDIIVNRASEIAGEPFDHVLCGSYRRGETELGDVDLMIRVPNDKLKYTIDIFHEVVDSLFTKGYIVGHLSGSASCSYPDRVCTEGENAFLIRGHDNQMDSLDNEPLSTGGSSLTASLTASGGVESQAPPLKKAKVVDTRIYFDKRHNEPGDSDRRTYMGLMRLGVHQPARRVDIKIFPHRCTGFGMLFFTGPEVYNRTLYTYLEKKTRMKMSMLRLTSLDGGGDPLGREDSDELNTEVNNRALGWGGVPFTTKTPTETDIYHWLGLRYQEPHMRTYEIFPELETKDRGGADGDASTTGGSMGGSIVVAPVKLEEVMEVVQDMEVPSNSQCSVETLLDSQYYE